MGEFEHEPAIEISKFEEAPKISEFGWGWLDMDHLGLH
jgi:hypothetical protein